MKMTTLALALLFATAGLSAVMPAASAFDWCVEGTSKDCTSHVVCVGRSYDSRGERCSVGVERPCPYDCHYLP